MSGQTDAYQAFLARKLISDPATGFEPGPMPSQMFPFQQDLTRWALRRGRAAIFAGTGLGKSFAELAWADRVSAHTGARVIHFAPLAVTDQMVSEAEKWGLCGKEVRTQADCAPGDNIVNYQKLEHFDLDQFGGVILDESSILKSYDGHYRTRLIGECARIPFRLAATATPAPNDFMELGNHAEFLGVMSYTDMLATFFVHDGGDTKAWRLKGHAENEFWRWMASWAVMLRTPSDLGYSNEGYDLPPLIPHQHTVKVSQEDAWAAGQLFVSEAQSMSERLAARRDTVDERVARAFKVVTDSEFSAKLATCGSQNTHEPAAQKVSLTPTIGQSETLKGTERTRKRGPNTTAPITPPTVSRPSPTASPQKSTATNGAGNSTPLKNSAASRPAPPQKRSAPSKREMADCAPNSELASSNTTPSSNNKEADAPSAEPRRPISEATGSTLTIATQLDASEASFVFRATPAWGASPTIPNGFSEPWCIWCNLNSEQDALEKLFGKSCFSVRGSDTDEQKRDYVRRWLAGERPVMLSKVSIMGFGMNFQHCAATVFVGLNDSFEQVYQAVRRFWRFGQKRPVHAHFIAAETEGAVVANIKRKEADFERMNAAMVAHMADLSSQAVRGQVRDRPAYDPKQPMIIPQWLESAA